MKMNKRINMSRVFLVLILLISIAMQVYMPAVAEGAVPPASNELEQDLSDDDNAPQLRNRITQGTQNRRRGTNTKLETTDAETTILRLGKLRTITYRMKRNLTTPTYGLKFPLSLYRVAGEFKADLPFAEFSHAVIDDIFELILDTDYTVKEATRL